jgi:hypothetical protein
MRRRTVTLPTVLPLTVLLTAASHGAAQSERAHFRVDMHVEQNGERLVMRRYVDGARSRMEIDADGEQFVVIEVGDANRTTYTLMPSIKRAMKSSLPPPAARSSEAGPLESEPDGVMELVGTEAIGGRAIEKYRVGMPESDGFVWIDPANQLPVRMEAGGSRVEMRNYDFSRLPAELFDVPKGYEIVDMNQMMKHFGPGRLIAGGAAGSVGGHVGGEIAGNIGAGIGGAFGGPVGAMVGRYLGQRVGRQVGQKAGSAAVK